MTRIILNGCRGAMGRTVARVASGKGDIAVVAGADVRVAAGAGGGPGGGISAGAGGGAGGGVGEAPVKAAFPEYPALSGIAEEADALVDFSSPAALGAVLAFATAKRLPALLASTGYTEAQKRQIADASMVIPIMQSANLSIGVSLMAELARKAAAALGDGFDVEIIEKHHNRKVDAPSGTALMLADAVNAASTDGGGGGSGGGYEYVYSRKERHEKRGKRELGIHCVRGGTIVGEHTLIFAGNDEVIEIRHAASSRDIFAEGAVRAARFLAAVGKPGLYGMGDVL